MSIAIVSDQNLVDLALQKYGVAESIIQLCSDNGLSLSDDLVSGAQIFIDERIEYKTTGVILGPLKSSLKATEMVIEHQNLVDAALQYYGSLEQLVTLCEENLLDVNSSLQAGMKLTLNASKVQRKQLVNYLDKKGININTGEVDESLYLLVEDGNYLLLENGFKIILG